MELKFGEYIIYFEIILPIFIVGYFGLYVIYGNIFLEYDTLTRVVLSTSASLLLLIPSVLAQIIAEGISGKSENKNDGLFFSHSFYSILIFTLIEFYDYDLALQQNPLLFLPLVLIISVMQFFSSIIFK